jgi:hypothetical protein
LLRRDLSTRSASYAAIPCLPWNRESLEAKQGTGNIDYEIYSEFEYIKKLGRFNIVGHRITAARAIAVAKVQAGNSSMSLTTIPGERGADTRPEEGKCRRVLLRLKRLGIAVGRVSSLSTAFAHTCKQLGVKHLTYATR